MADQLRGRIWRFGDNVDTDQIIPAEYLVSPDPAFLGKHAFEKARPEFAQKVQRGDVIVAGRNFGAGSSREHAARALLGAGISCVVAKSFARIFFRNAINLGLPLVEADLAIPEGAVLEIDLAAGKLRDPETGAETPFPKYPPFVMALIAKGGLINYTKERLKWESKSA